MRDGDAAPVLVIGGGGHAKVVISTLRATGVHPCAVFDDDRARWGTTLCGLPIRGPIARVQELGGARGVLAIGGNVVRAQIAAALPGVEWLSVVHPRAAVDETVELGPGTVVFAGAVIQPDTRLGSHVIVNTGATVDHDCEVGEYVHLAPGVHVAGGVRIGAGAFLGIGASVIPGRVLGAGCTVGAGAVVVRDVPDRITVVGVPARPLKRTES